MVRDPKAKLKTYGKRGFSVIDMENGEFQLLTYIVGHPGTANRGEYGSKEHAVAHGYGYITPVPRWVDVTDECTFAEVSVTDYTSPLVMVLWKGCTIHPKASKEFKVENNRVYKKQTYYDTWS